MDLKKRNDEENAKEKLYTYASYVQVESFKMRSTLFPPLAFGLIHLPQGLQTLVVEPD